LAQGLKGFTATGDSEEIARALFNALAFLPARTNPPLVRCTFERKRVTFLATDCYTVGQDWAVMESGPIRPVEVWIDQDAAKAFESTARKDCMPKSRAPQDSDGKGRGVFTYHPGDSLVFTPQLEGSPASGRDHTGHSEPVATPAGVLTPDALWEACDGLLERLEERDPSLPNVAMFDPSLLARFAKVKTPGKQLTHMDMWFADASNVVLVKIGARFRGAIMAVNRDVAAENEHMEPEGLW
jgi:hypothetical protein